MIQLFFATSVNVYKIGIALEEMALPWEAHLIDISKGEHLDPANIAGAPTLKLPVIRDTAPADGGEPLVIFESGAILEYLATRTGRFLSTEARARGEVLQWLFWQIGNLGPTTGQAWHFHAFASRIAPEIDNRYSHDRYFKMMAALWRVMDRRLSERPFLAGDYSIADIACYPWIIYLDPLEGMDAFPNIRRWRDTIAARPAVQRLYARIPEIMRGYEVNERSMVMYPWEGIMENVITV